MGAGFGIKGGLVVAVVVRTAREIVGWFEETCG